MAVTESTGRIPQWTLGERLRKAREEAGMEVPDIAIAMSRSEATIYAWEGGTRNPSFKNILRWAVVTGTDEVWLAHGIDGGGLQMHKRTWKTPSPAIAA